MKHGNEEILRSESVEIGNGKRMYITLTENPPVNYTYVGGGQDDIIIVEYKYSLTSNRKISEEQIDLFMKIIKGNTQA